MEVLQIVLGILLLLAICVIGYMVGWLILLLLLTFGITLVGTIIAFFALESGYDNFAALLFLLFAFVNIYWCSTDKYELLKEKLG